MKPLIEYTKNGHHFTIWHREENLAIFHGRSKAGNSETWELIKVQSHNGRDIAGKWFDAAEYPPSNEQWGIAGWSFVSRNDAMVKMQELKANQ